VLDGLVDEPRAIISGGAGTGKTLLALEEARRFSAAGKSVLLVCFNRQLASFLQKATSSMAAVRTASLHSYMADVVRRADLESELPAAAESELFEVFYPELCFRAVVDRLVSDRFDVLIIDAGQDLLSNAYLDVFDSLVASGLSGGTWRIFYDRRQNLFEGTEPIGLRRVRQSAVTFNLTLNCRNTFPIGVSTSLLCGLDPMATLRVDGDDVVTRWYNDPAEERRLLGRDIATLLSSGFRPKDLVILSRRRIERSCVAAGLPGVSGHVTDISESTPATGDLPFSTVQSFKGLEADAVFLIDVDALLPPDAASAMYVGASRARTNLYVYLEAGVRAVYEDRAASFGRRVAGAG
jgi:superfamily I DNA/RNA helicase